ncbi:MAG TPA: M28 family peptidase [Longimicrobiales bacterium]|nr:M28 family peptidase [Longimicrobiales bacterium]
MRLYALSAVALLSLAACPGDTRSTGMQRSVLALDTTSVPHFDADSAHALLRHQVSFGPRVPNSPGHAAQLAWMSQYLHERADTLHVTRFTHRARNGTTLAMANLFARFRPELGERVLLVAHWDTRPTADYDSERQDEPILGANDGASGTAVLLEMANVLSRHSAPIGVDLLFVDGEDYGPDGGDMYLGAKFFAANLPAGYRPLYGILVDMVGDQSPRFRIEENSRDYAPEVVERVWRVAEQIGLGHIFVRESAGAINDDHVPLNKAGIRTIDIIDFDYGPGNAYWHTHDDVVEHTSPVGLGAVGRVLTVLIYNGG